MMVSPQTPVQPEPEIENGHKTLDSMLAWDLDEHVMSELENQSSTKAHLMQMDIDS